MNRYWRGSLLKLAALAAFAATLTGGATRAQQLQAIPGRESKGTIRQAQRLNAQEGFVLTDTALLATDDGGATWSDRTPEGALDGITSAFFLDASRGFLAGVAFDRLNLLQSEDGFESWRGEPIDASKLPRSQSYAEARVHFLDDTHGWLLGRLATSSAFSVGKLYRTTDGGESWERLPSPPAAGRFRFVDSRLGFMVGAPVSERLYRTRDGGRSWQALRLGLSVSAGAALYDLPVFHSTTNGTLAVTLRGRRPQLLTFVTRDGGDSFQHARTIDLPARDYEEPVPAALTENGSPAALARNGSVALGPGGARTLSVARAGITQGRTQDSLAPSVLAMSVVDEETGWALVAEGGCDRTGCRQTTRLVSLDDAPNAVGNDLLVRTNVSPQMESAAISAAGNVISNSKGFDKCAAGTTSQMQTWKTSSPYKDANIYFGGSSRGCSQPNLNAAWVKSVFQQGWRLIPTWVGPQAPCTNFSRRISSTPATARSEGQAEADAAVAAAAALGLGAGTPLYYDLEAYGGGGTCSLAVQAFVNAWTERLKAKGYVSGVYGLPRNAQADWRAGVVANPADAVWLAYYACTGSSCSWTPRTLGIPGLSDTYWPSNQRIVQYWNSHNETYGGVTFTIDTNIANGPVATDSPAPTCTTAVSADRWKGEYFQNRTLSGQASLVRDDGAASLNFDWGTGSPGASCGVPADQFSVRWTRTVSFTTGRYRFTATTDDGVRLYVDNALKIDKWVDRGPTTDLVDVDLAAGNHALRVEYYEAAGGAVARLSFERIGDVPGSSIVVDDGPADASGVVEFLQTATGRPEWWHRETTVGYGNDMVWTTNTATRQDNYARWKPKLPQAGSYKVEAYIPSANATSERARYVIVASGASQTRIVNQNALSNVWADLGTYNFRADGTEYIELGDVTGETSNSRRVGFDAMRFTPAAPPPNSCQATVAANRWKGEYFNGASLSGSPLMVRDDGDGSLNFDWGTGSPGASCGVPVDQFSARFSRTASFSAGNYRFTVVSDDGFRLYMDGVLKLDKWIVQAPATYTVDVSLAAGDHALRLEYFEAAGGAVAKLSWQVVTPPSSGAWAFPVGAETTGAPWRVTLGLGQSWTASSGKQYNGHLAEDWSKGSGNLGSPVYAAAEGEVVTALQNCGNYVDVVVLRHNEFVDGEQIYTMYGHIETTLRVGDRVRRRQQIGVLGDPVTFGPHLHFEVKTKTALLNLPFSACANPSRGVYVSAGYSGRRGDYGGADSWDPTDSVRGNVYFHPTRFIRKRLPAAATLISAEPLGPPAVPSAADGLPRCEPQ